MRRYGKPFVLDMMEVDMYQTCVDRFDGIMPGLMDSLMDKSILQEEKLVSHQGIHVINIIGITLKS